MINYELDLAGNKPIIDNMKLQMVFVAAFLVPPTIENKTAQYDSTCSSSFVSNFI